MSYDEGLFLQGAACLKAIATRNNCLTAIAVISALRVTKGRRQRKSRPVPATPLRGFAQAVFLKAAHEFWPFSAMAAALRMDILNIYFNIWSEQSYLSP